MIIFGYLIHVFSHMLQVTDQLLYAFASGNMVDWEILIITARPNPLPRPQCPICLDDMFFEEEKPSLACGIRFHGHCLETWKIRVT